MSKQNNTKTIDKLTPAQEAKFLEYRERFEKLGLSTKPMDKPAAEQAVMAYYKYLEGKGDTKIPANGIKFIWENSPLEGAKRAAMLKNGTDKFTSAEVQEQASLACYGSLESYWAAAYAFIAYELPVEKDPFIDIAMGIIENCGVFWLFEEVCVMTPRPTEIHLKDNVLHNTEGPALYYKDGDSIYFYEGKIKNTLLEVILAAKNKESNGDDEAA